MRWRRLPRSRNVRDFRGRRRAAGLRLGRRGGSLAALVVIVLVALIGGPEAVELLLDSGGPADVATPTQSLDPADRETGDFVAAVLGSTEQVWGAVFADSGAIYEPPELTLFRGTIDSACGYASSAVGPFYCPSDRRIYLDTSFFDALARMGGPGDFAQAYVIGHEVGHHVQTLLGLTTSARARGADQNRHQVAIELQADCFAGIWANRADRGYQFLEPGDIDEGLNAAAAIGDDRLQRNAGRHITPETFTHGSSVERRHWLREGLTTGELEACDTAGEEIDEAIEETEGVFD